MKVFKMRGLFHPDNDRDQHSATADKTVLNRCKRKCDRCKETFNLSYFSQLRSEYRILSSDDKARAPHAMKVIDEIIADVERRNAVSCDDLFNFEKAVVQLKPLEAIRQELANVREKYKGLVGADNYYKYVRMASRPESDELTIRGDVDYVMSEIHLLYAILPSRERLKRELISLSFATTLAVSIIAGLIMTRVGYGVQLLLLSMIMGAFGGFLSMVRKVQEMPHNIDVTVNFLQLKYGKFSVALSPLVGSLFAVVFMLLLATNLVGGIIFPEIGPEIVDSIHEGRHSLVAFDEIKLCIWSFIAGFAERLVPDTLDRILSEKETGTRPPRGQQ